MSKWEAIIDINASEIYSDLEKIVMTDMIEKGYNPWDISDVIEFWMERLG